MKRPKRKQDAIWSLSFAYLTLSFNFFTGILFVPLYLSHIDVILYGAWLASGNLLAWFTLFDPGIGRVLTQRVSTSFGLNRRDEVGQYLFPGFVLVIGISMIVCASGYFLAQYVPDVVRLRGEVERGELRSAFSVAVIGLGVSMVSFAPGAVLRGLLRSHYAGIAGVSGMIMYCVTILALLFSGFGLMALAYGLLVRGLVVLILGLGFMVFVMKKEKISFQRTITKIGDLAQASVYAFFSKSSTKIIGHVDALAVSMILGPAAVTPFVLTKRGIGFAATLLMRPTNSLLSGIAHLRGEGNEEKMQKLLRTLMKFFILTGIFSGFGFLALNKDFIIVWVGEEFFAGQLITSLFVASFLAQLLKTIAVDLGQSFGMFKRTAKLSVLDTVLFFVVLVVGASFFSKYGIAAAQAVSSGLFLGVPFMVYLLMPCGIKKEDFFESFLRPFSVSLLAGALALLATRNVTTDSLGSFLAAVMLFGGVFLGILYLLDRGSLTEIFSRLAPKKWRPKTA